ncbi:Arc family DNA-binding protein [Thomasclavelia cocleata]|nr:Arc family DNA-binding protein [Thomasclavelia cocleata]
MEKIKKYTLTIPIELLEDIKKKADKKGMSLNDYILLIINQKLNKL